MTTSSLPPIVLNAARNAQRNISVNADAAMHGLRLRLSVLTGKSDVGDADRSRLRRECGADLDALNEALDVLRSILTRQENGR